MNLLPAHGPVRPTGTAPPGATVTESGRLEIGFRPEAVTLGPADGAEASVDRVEVVGEDAYAYLTVAGGHSVVARVPAVRRPERGAALRVGVRWRDVHVFHSGSGRRYAP